MVILTRVICNYQRGANKQSQQQPLERPVLNHSLRQVNGKANICNGQFQAAFNRKADSYLNAKGGSPFSSIGDVTVQPNGIIKLLDI